MQRNAGGSVRRRGLVLAGAVALIGLFASPAIAAAGAAGGHKKALTPLQEGLAFYKGKAITIIAPASPGGGPDLNARLVAPFLESYLHCQVNIVDNGSGGSYPAQDQAAASPPDGLTVGILTSAVIEAQLTNQPALNFNPIRETFLGTGGPAVSIWVSAPSSPYTTFESIVNSPTPVTMLALPSGASFFNIASVNGIWGVKYKYIYYPTTAPMLQGFLRGDGPVSSFSTGMVGSSIIGGAARPLLYTNPLPAGMTLASYLRGVPTVADFAKKHPPKTKAQRLALSAYENSLGLTGSLFFVPPRTPGPRVVALQAALKYALGPVSRSNALLESILPGYITGAQTKKDYEQVLGLGKYLSAYLNAPA